MDNKRFPFVFSNSPNNFFLAKRVHLIPYTVNAISRREMREEAEVLAGVINIGRARLDKTIFWVVFGVFSWIRRSPPQREKAMPKILPFLVEELNNPHSAHSSFLSTFSLKPKHV